MSKLVNLLENKVPHKGTPYLDAQNKARGYLQKPRRTIRNSEFKIQNLELRAQNSEFKIQNSRNRVRLIQNSEIKNKYFTERFMFARFLFNTTCSSGCPLKDGGLWSLCKCKYLDILF